MPNSTRALIPKPWPDSTNYALLTLIKLREEMGWDQARFTEYMYLLRKTARSLGFDLTAGPDGQGDGLWARLVQECIKTFPRLVDFEDAWPIDIYYRKYSYRYKDNLKTKKRKAATADESDDADESPIRRKSRKENVQEPALRESGQSVSQQRKDTGERSQKNMHNGTRSDTTMPSENGQQQTGNPVASTIAPPAQQLTVVRSTTTAKGVAPSSESAAVERVKCTPCLFCGHRLPVPPAQRAALDKFLSQAYGMEELVEGLTYAGVATDCAFSALVRLSRRQRDEFLRGLNTTPLLRTILMNLFDEYIDRLKMKTSTGCRDVMEHSGTAAGMPEETNDAHRCPLRPVRKPKIPPVLDALLRAHEMEDLGPVFLALGFRSDDHVKRILVSQAMQAELLAEENLTRLHVHLTDFQIMMMRYILAEA